MILINLIILENMYNLIENRFILVFDTSIKYAVFNYYK